MPRPKQNEIPLQGEGVAPVKDKKLDALCDTFIDDRDAKANLAELLTATEAKILDRMRELNITVHRFGDQEARIKEGTDRIKIKTVTVESVGGDDPGT